MAKKKLTPEEKYEYMRIGLTLAGLNVNTPGAELAVRVYEGIMAKGGSFDLSDACKIAAEVEIKYFGERHKKEAEVTLEKQPAQ